MKKTVIALACVLASSTAFAASITTGFGFSSTTGDSTYIHKGGKTTWTDKKTSIIDGDKSSVTKYTSSLVAREGYEGARSLNALSVNTFMGTGNIREGVVLSAYSETDTVTGHPYLVIDGSFGSGNESLNKGYSGKTFKANGKTVNKTANGKEIVTTFENWTESGYFSRDTISVGASATVYAE